MCAEGGGANRDAVEQKWERSSEINKSLHRNYVKAFLHLRRRRFGDHNVRARALSVGRSFGGRFFGRSNDRVESVGGLADLTLSRWASSFPSFPDSRDPLDKKGSVHGFMVHGTDSVQVVCPCWRWFRDLAILRSRFGGQAG